MRPGLADGRSHCRVLGESSERKKPQNLRGAVMVVDHDVQFFSYIFGVPCTYHLSVDQMPSQFHDFLFFRLSIKPRSSSSLINWMSMKSSGFASFALGFSVTSESITVLSPGIDGYCLAGNVCSVNDAS